ncbi:pyruvate dehydrogenase phosphatase regulatory subunit, mitochondrial-like isoform X2 [Toxorhynchites rutilus septentrionalis]|uniref:pyruvate dehydrogenase phosphatase regulatory subunit, mitochondrial-like isoform X2 n=1 Tax=Toxorhynchites rutilus septentrionalis TaxID=329112 RepID=UPI002479E43B|nr:pyruvate dehydrogenase phosphatase regulatory subunit, mitochondrial-like isoform X2 [Toxorhynchites rutilus septentrionalis]
MNLLPKLSHPLKISLQQYSTGSENLTQASRVVIAGAGLLGNSVAFHLTENGWNNIVVLDQNRIGSGTSDFGSGTIGLFKPTPERNIIMESVKLYDRLQNTGYNVGLKRCGSLNLAQTHDRIIALKRRIAYNVPTGLFYDIQGAVYVPDDCVADPALVLEVLAKLAKQNGVKYFEGCEVRYVNTKGGRVDSVETDVGTIKCEYFINCSGMWSRELGLKCRKPVCIPAHPAQHFYALSSNLNLPTEKLLPCVRDYDSNLYVRQLEEEMLVGWFEKEAKPAFEGTKDIPKEWKTQLDHNFTNHCWPLWEKAVERIPLLKDTIEPNVTNSPDNFTPDGRWMFGETAEVKNYYVACGMNGNPLQGSGGVGKALAEWVVSGTPTIEMLPFNIQRFLSLHNNRQYLQQRIKEVVGRQYAILYPNQSEYKYSRKLRCSPLYSVLETRGAVFGTKMAYERALYFDTDYERGSPLPKLPPGSFYKPKFFHFMEKEYFACAQHVGIIDISSFSKIEIKPGVQSERSKNNVLEYLQKMCCNDVDVEIGHIVHTGMLNDHGGFENDCMLIRQDGDHFFMISPSSQQTRIYDWMSRNLPLDASVKLNDVTSMYTVINVVGPKSTQLMSELSNSNVKLQPFTYRKLNIGYASDVMIMSFTHTGMPGYCLYVPSEYALHVYDRLMAVGRDYGARDVGTLTQRVLRIDKFIPFWGDELTSMTTPFEAGVNYTVRLDKKDDFIGRAALEKQKREGLMKRLVLFHVEDIDIEKDVWPWGGEPLYRNGEYCGTVTSAGYGFSSEKLVCLGYISRTQQNGPKVITTEFIMDKNAVYHIDIAGRQFRLTQHLHPKAALAKSLAEREERKRYRPTVLKFKQQFQT